MTTRNEEQKAWLHEVLKKVHTVTDRGLAIIQKIPEMIKKSQQLKIDPNEIEAIQVNERVLKRRYGTKQAAAMAGISHTLLYAAEEDGRLPKPDFRKDTPKKTRAGYTINQINNIREVFGTAPRKPEGALASIIGVLNLKGGSQKTTLCHLFSQYLAIRGYRVLVLDTDPQGSLSFYFGKRPDVDVHYEHTVAPYLLEDDESLIEAGHPEGSSQNLRYAIQKTYWDNIDIIPACLQNLNIDLLMTNLVRESGRSTQEHIEKLRYGLVDIAEDYDFILLDGTPSLNISTLNVVTACDVVFVPTPAAMSDYASTLQFSQLIADTIESYDESDFYPNIPDIRYVITKYSKSSYAQFMGQVIRKTFNVERGDVLTNESHHSDEIGKATNRITSIYEVNPSEADNRSRLKLTIEKFDLLFEEMHDEVYSACWEGAERMSHLEKKDEIEALGEMMMKALEKEGTGNDG
jgi:chromosome partitioning protein